MSKRIKGGGDILTPPHDKEHEWENECDLLPRCKPVEPEQPQEPQRFCVLVDGEVVHTFEAENRPTAWARMEVEPADPQYQLETAVCAGAPWIRTGALFNDRLRAWQSLVDCIVAAGEDSEKWQYRVVKVED
jgi:hypothetical protein